ncbi:MAG: alpha-galactosidase, partial [Actinobacteria bacterium]|nr:alpha-galactosidase [Actinomycetota bacterium]
MTLKFEFNKDSFINNPPFSFKYKGCESRDFIGKWFKSKKEADLGDKRVKEIYEYFDSKTKLQITCEVIFYLDFQAVEWILYFKNNSNSNSPILENIQAIDFKLNSSGEYNIHSINGSGQLPSDFAPVKEPIRFGMNITKSCYGGRSSSGGFAPDHLGGSCPFFKLEEVRKNRGAILAIGWTGQWMAIFSHSEEKSLRIRAGMEYTHLKLYPGETIRTPRILLLFWEGKETYVGNNLFRKFIMKHKFPRIEGNLVEIPIAASTFNKHCDQPFWIPGYDGQNGYTEANQIKHAKRCKELGIEYYWLDAGWFNGGWPYGVGNWTVNKKTFPNGLKKISSAVKDLGLKFILWFEPERVCPGTEIANEHPQWLLKDPTVKKHEWPIETEFNIFMERRFHEQTAYILNLGIDEAGDWITNRVSRIISENGIDIYRHDCNYDLLEYWRNADAEDRQGATEIHYIEGLYKHWDKLLSSHPGLIIDICASGDRRIDLETISRGIIFWRDDYWFCEPIGTQCATYGLNLFIPGHAGGFFSKNFSKYEFRGLLSGGAAITWDLEQEDFPDNLAKSLIGEVKKLRHVFYGDFWPLTKYDLSQNCWMAWQFDRADLGTGAIFAFRRSKVAENKIKL